MGPTVSAWGWGWAGGSVLSGASGPLGARGAIGKGWTGVGAFAAGNAARDAVGADAGWIEDTIRDEVGATGPGVGVVARMGAANNMPPSLSCGMAHNRQRNQLTYEPENQREMLEAFYEATAQDDLVAWFGAPWNDGRNAVRLLCDLDKRMPKPDSPEAWLRAMLDRERASLTTEDYERAELYRYETSRTDHSRYGLLTDAALTVYANWIACSDGGGHVPNVHLTAVVSRLLWTAQLESDQANAVVGAWRATDAGLPWSGVGTAAPWARRAAAHRWFWLNRRYRMAYDLAAPGPIPLT